MEKKKTRKSFVLVTVSGGCASVQARGKVEVVCIDWDNWESHLPTKADIELLRGQAALIPDRKLRASIQGEIEELEGRGVADEE